jgi:hypothetical protein
MQLRRRDHVELLLPDTSKLQQWTNQSAMSFFITESGSVQAAKDFPVGLINLIRETRLPVLWALRFADFWEGDMSCIDILRILLLQAIQINPRTLAHESYPITVTHFREAATETDWFTLLCRALDGLPPIYIVLDGDLLGHATAHNRYVATRWLETFRELITKTVIKVFVSALTIDEGYVARNWDSNTWSKLRTDKLGSIRDQRRRRKISYRRTHC